MRVEEFDFILPEHLIAQTPLSNRTASRLLILDKKTGAIEHKHFYDIIDYLNPGDHLVLNDTKVMPSRVIGQKQDTNAVIELLLLKDLGLDTWEALAKPAKRVKAGTTISFGDGLLIATCVRVEDEGIRIFQMKYQGIFLEILDRLGEMPLPPYIHEKLSDQDRYQTVYAASVGSAAAPTAGLHFTKEFLKAIELKGIKIHYVTLHVGLGTFRTVSVNDVEKHQMHKESYHMSQETADALNKAKKNGQRIICVGTTSTRTLESIYQKFQSFHEDASETGIFIYPGYQFLATDALITNFHLPKSTLIMLVSALASREHILKAYHEAIKEQYRFFSFGDAMFIK